MEEKRLDRLEEKVDTIMSNHLVHVKDDISELKSAVSVVATNVMWLMRTYFIVVGASVGSLVAAIMGLILK